MEAYFKDKNITEICNDYMKQFDVHSSVDNVRLYLFTMWRYSKHNRWQKMDSYGLKHMIERATEAAHDEPYCSNFVVKAILYEMMLNDMVDLGLFIRYDEKIMKLENDSLLSKIMWDDTENLCFKFKDNVNINV